MNTLLLIYIGTVAFTMLTYIIDALAMSLNYKRLKKTGSKIMTTFQLIVIALVPVINVMCSLLLIFQYEENMKSLVEEGTFELKRSEKGKIEEAEK